MMIGNGMSSIYYAYVAYAYDILYVNNFELCSCVLASVQLYHVYLYDVKYYTLKTFLCRY